MNSRFRFAAALAIVALCLVPQAALAADTGTANFTRYVALGDSLTAGFCSGGLVRNCQLGSYPLLVFAQATDRSPQEASSVFQQPLVSTPGLSGQAVCRNPASPLAPCGVLRLVSLAGPAPTILPIPGQAVPQNLTLPRPYDNMGVPGATVHDLLATLSGGFHDLILRGQGATQLQQGLSLQPTFVTLWIGNNDALGAATNGSDSLLTPAAQFDAEYRIIAGAIAGVGAKMAVANIPDVTSIPFVTTVSRFVPNPATGQPILINGNPVPLIGQDGPLQSGDFVLLSATTEISAGRGIPAAIGGSGIPLSDAVVLTAGEAANIRARVDQYNATIAAVAQQHGAALVDAKAFLNDVRAHGVNVGGVTYNSAFLTGGLFSYDGVHPTAFGYAYIANLFIDAINARFGGNIEPVDLYPFVFGTNGIGNPAAVGDEPLEYFEPASVVFSDEASHSVTDVFAKA
ncbi:MAG TPA: SGNH/GDSL hydrolase family protein, partial [Thermoanaerobaculia bacterium]|nr:SGNH/GDSL hydrolase family protein [Thermoanaerobaculia bacterium]